KSVEARQKYLEHLQGIFELLGDTPDAARANARTVMEVETALAKASLTRVDQRDPHKLFHKMSVKQLEAITPSFGWARYLKASGLANISQVNVSEPAFYKELEAQLK